jgi:hypothetical protein
VSVRPWSLLEYGVLPPALEVLLVHLVYQEGDLRDAGLGEGDAQIQTYALSVHSPAAVDHDGLSCDKGGCVAGEEGDQVAYVLGFAAALEALLVENASV